MVGGWVDGEVEGKADSTRRCSQAVPPGGSRNPAPNRRAPPEIEFEKAAKGVWGPKPSWGQIGAAERG